MDVCIRRRRGVDAQRLSMGLTPIRSGQRGSAVAWCSPPLTPPPLPIHSVHAWAMPMPELFDLKHVLHRVVRLHAARCARGCMPCVVLCNSCMRMLHAHHVWPWHAASLQQLHVPFPLVHATQTSPSKRHLCTCEPVDGRLAVALPAARRGLLPGGRERVPPLVAVPHRRRASKTRRERSGLQWRAWLGDGRQPHRAAARSRQCGSVVSPLRRAA